MQNVFTAHKQIEQTLRYLSMIAERANEGIVVVDLDGSLRFVNEAWVEMHGYKTKDEIIGKQLSLFHTKEQMKTDVTPLLEETKRCGQLVGTVEHIKSDGTVFPTQTKMILVGDEAGKATGLIVFAADIGQQTKLQETTVGNLKRVKHLSQRITRLRKLLGECLEVEECLAEQTGELQANNEILLQQMSELDQSPRRPEQYPEQIVRRQAQETTTNQRREDTNPEHRQSKEAPAEKSEPMVSSKRSGKLLNTKELMEVAELAMRVSGRS
jgi:PAS domain S-box-containing protein